MKVAVYCRVSTEEQRDRETIVTQRDFGQRYCESKGDTIFDFYEDDGISATKYPRLSQRPAGARLLADARLGRFDVVCVYKMDRLGRGAHNLFNVMDELEQYVGIISMTESINTATPSGRLMRTMIAGMGEYERDTFIERSTEATNRLAREGQWMGGITPYGYRVEGFKRDARLAIAEEPLEGMAMSEADIVRLIYKLCADEGWSTNQIAKHLNSLGVPPAYSRDGRQVLRGKRRETTQGIWRDGRICNMIKNTTFKGVHFYGRRSNKKREIIERAVPAIVSSDVWDRAQATLTRNALFSARTAKRQYLLRGLMKCAGCGMTYIGTASQVIANRSDGTQHKVAKVYYKCNGKHNARSLDSTGYVHCSSKSVNGEVENIVMRDIERFLRNPGDVLNELQNILAVQSRKPENLQEKVTTAKALVRGKQEERDRMLALFRKGRIDESTLDRQLDDIKHEEEALIRQADALNQEYQSARNDVARVDALEPLLEQLRQHLDQPLKWEVKRQLVEILVESISVETHFDGARKVAKVVVTYCFDDSSQGKRTSTLATGLRTDVPADFF
jgi:site-specific DNA recombinase